MFLGRKRLLVCAAIGLGVLAFGIGASAYYAVRQASHALDDAVRAIDAELTARPDVVASVEPIVTTQLSSSITTLEPPAVQAEPDGGAPIVAASALPTVTRSPLVDSESSAPAPAPAVVEKPSASFPSPPPLPPRPDLAITGMSLSPDNPVRGQTITSSIRGVNRGTGTAENILVRIDVQYQIVGRWVTVASFSRSIASLEPGQETGIQRSATVPQEAPPGRYRIVVSIDPAQTKAGASTQDGQRILEFVVQ